MSSNVLTCVLDGVKMYSMESLLTIEQAAKILAIDPETVRVYCRKGIIPSVKIGRVFRIKPKKLDSFITASEVMPKDYKRGS